MQIVLMMQGREVCIYKVRSHQDVGEDLVKAGNAKADRLTKAFMGRKVKM